MMDSSNEKHQTPDTARPSPDSASLPEMRHFSRQQLAGLWQQSRSGAALTGEEGRLLQAMRDHPEYHDLWDSLESLGDAEIMRDGVNPIAHVMFHTIVENQLAEADPAQVSKTLQALLDQGYSRHEAIHRIVSVFMEEFFAVMKSKRPFSQKAYIRQLKKLARG